MTQSSSIQMVITVALSKELPLDWLSQHHVSVVTFEALSSGGVAALTAFKGGILVIITGVGANVSKQCMLWIKQHIAPLYVVNYGAVGDVSGRHPLGTLIQPTLLSNHEGVVMDLSKRLPFFLDYAQGVLNTSALRSSLTRSSQDPKDTFLDMEAYYQAAYLKDSPISFHVVKSVTDYANESAASLFEEGLLKCQENFKRVFGFLARFSTVEPKISVVIPTHNRLELLKRALNSVFSQTVQPHEIIIVEDGSTDDTLRFLRSLRDRVVVVQNLNMRGVSSSRNLGVKKSTGDWIAFLDSDDEWHPEKLEKQCAFIRDYPFYDLIHSEEIMIRNGDVLPQKNQQLRHSGWIFDAVVHHTLISLSSVLVFKPFFDRFSGFSDDFSVCEDYDFFLRVTRWHPVGLDPTQSLIRYLGLPDQLSVKYPLLDSIRVKSLFKILKVEKDPVYIEFLSQVLHVRVEALIGIYKSKQDSEKIQYYENFMDKLLALVS